MNRSTGRINVDPEGESRKKMIIFVIIIIIFMVAVYLAVNRIPEEIPVEPTATEQTVQ